MFIPKKSQKDNQKQGFYHQLTSCAGWTIIFHWINHHFWSVKTHRRLVAVRCPWWPGRSSVADTAVDAAPGPGTQTWSYLPCIDIILCICIYIYMCIHIYIYICILYIYILEISFWYIIYTISIYGRSGGIYIYILMVLYLPSQKERPANHHQNYLVDLVQVVDKSPLKSSGGWFNGHDSGTDWLEVPTICKPM